MTGEQKDWKKKGAKNASERSNARRFNDAQFIQYELDKASQSACKAWEVTSDALVDAIDRLADDGYRVTVKWDTYSASFMCSLQQIHDDGRNKGYILTGRGSTGCKALKQVLFKHYTVMQEDWQEFAGFDRKAEIDD